MVRIIEIILFLSAFKQTVVFALFLFWFLFFCFALFLLSLSLSLFFFLFSFSFPLFISFCLLFFSLSFVARLDSFYTTYSECVSWPSLKDLTKPNNTHHTHPPPPPWRPSPLFLPAVFSMLSMSLWKEIVAICGLALLQTLMWHCTSPQCQE